MLNEQMRPQPPTDLESALAYLETLDRNTLLGLQARIPSILEAKSSKPEHSPSVPWRKFTNGWYLPADLVHIIFGYLPIESLCEARYVCKSVYQSHTLTELPAQVYVEGGKLYEKSIRDTFAYLSRYPKLREWNANHLRLSYPPDSSDLHEVANIIPLVTHLIAGENRIFSLEQIDYLVSQLPLKCLQSARWTPSDVSSLTRLEVTYGFSNFIETPPLQSSTLKWLRLQLLTVDTELIQGCPNLEVLVLNKANLQSPLVHPKLLQLVVNKVSCDEAITGLTSLGQFCIAGPTEHSIANNSMTFLQISHRYYALDRVCTDVSECSALRKVSIMGNTTIKTRRVEEVFSTHSTWLTTSVLPSLHTLTLDWIFLDHREVLSDVMQLQDLSWIKGIRTLNLRLPGRSSDEAEEWIEICDMLLGEMPNLVSLTIEGYFRRFVWNVTLSCVKEVTFEGDFEVRDEERILAQIDRCFPNLETLRVPAYMIYNYSSTHFLDTCKNRNVKYLVWVGEKDDVSVKFEELVNQGRAGYYDSTDLLDPWDQQKHAVISRLW